jgi:hypothetical protein
MEQAMDNLNNAFNGHTIDREYVFLAMEYVRQNKLNQAKQLFMLADFQWELILQIVSCESNMHMLSTISKQTKSEEIKKEAASYMKLFEKAHMLFHTSSIDRPMVFSEKEAEVTYRVIENIKTYVFKDIDVKQVVDFMFENITEQA